MDGLRINPGTIGNAAIQNIAPELVERVEIVKGPRSTLYGSEAIGGVINVITRRGADEGSSVQAGFGSFRYAKRKPLRGHRQRARQRPRSGRSWLESDGFPTRTGDTTDRGYENTSFTASARADAGPVELGVRGWYASGTTQYSDFFVTPVDQDFENSALAVYGGSRALGSPGHSGSSAAHRSTTWTRTSSADFDSNGVKISRNTALGLDWQNDLVAVREQHADGGHCCGRTRTPMPNPSACRTPRTRRRASSMCRTRPRSVRTACFSAPPIRITRPSGATRPGTLSTDSQFQDGAFVAAGGGHGVPGAGCDRSLRIRREPGPRSGGITELRASLPPAASANVSPFPLPHSAMKSTS